MKRFLAIVCVSLLGTGIILNAADDKPAQKPSTTSPAFDAMKKLVGDWFAKGPDGKTIETKFRITAGGSVLVETLMPGQAEEMITVYHMDGSDFILTHYCMLGNQPRLKADSTKETKKLSFKSVGGTNMKMSDMHMGQATFTIVDADHFESEWCSCNNGKPDENHQVKFKFTRKK